MSADLPHTLYKSNSKAVTQKDVDDAEQKMREAYERKMKRKAEKEMSIEDVFAQANEIVETKS